MKKKPKLSFEEKHLPKYIRRIDDGELFVRGSDGLYQNQKFLQDFPNHFHFSYTYANLMIHHKGFFDIAYDLEKD